MTTTKEPMADISASKVKELRERTGAGMMDCKRALEEAGGDVDKAIVLLRESGQATAAKKAGRDAREGTVRAISTPVAALACSSRSTARPTSSPATRTSRSSCATWQSRSPAWTPSTRRSSPFPAEVLAAKRAELLADESVQGKPENIREQIVEGQLRKWFQSAVLYEQVFRDTDQKVGDLITDAIARIGENIRVRRFTRYQLGRSI